MSDLIERLITDPSESTIDDLFEDHNSIFWVDWKEDDAVLAEYVGSLINSVDLKAERDGEDIYLSFKEKKLKVPLTLSGKDRHITLMAINEIMAEEYETRMVWASEGGDTLAFTTLSKNSWEKLEEKYGNPKVASAFFKLVAEANVFTDRLGKFNPAHAKVSKKPIWKF